MTDSTDTLTDILDRIAASAASGDGTLLAALVDEVRPDDASDGAQATKNLQALQYLLATNDARRVGLSQYLRTLLDAHQQIEHHTDFGILPGTGFFTEATRRFMHRWLPPVLDAGSLARLLATVFPKRDDHEWIEAVDDAHWCELFALLAIDFGDAASGAATPTQIVESTRIIAHRIAALGLEPDLVAIRPELRRHASPFIAQCAETQTHLDRLASGTAVADDARHIGVLLDQCDAVIARVRRATSETGIGVGLTYILQRLSENIERQRALLVLVDPADDADRRGAAARLLKAYVTNANTGNDLRGHFAKNTELLAREITEHSGRTGEHYITSTRDEYRVMFRAALGAGLIVPLMALAKLWMTGLHAAPVLQGLLYSLNYAAGFILIHVLHFTLATKQPAMTATRMAQALESGTGKRLDLSPLVELIVRVSRTQFIAIVGNVALALPLAWLLSRGLTLFHGAPPADAAKSAHLLHDIHPWASLALFHAAIAGVYLFLSGLVSGYFDNLAVYRQIPARIRQLGWLRALLGDARADRFSRYVEHNLGGLAGNAFFGLTLGMTAVIGFNIGLPLDIRHVTFAAANFGIAANTLGATGLTWTDIGIACAGIALVGVVNLAVSFTLALLVAMKARRVRFRHAHPLFVAVLKRFAKAPLDFVRPPREVANNGKDGPPNIA